LLQFSSTLQTNIEKLSGPVQASIPIGGITSGSVNVQTSVVFLNGNSGSVEAYKSAMTSSSSSVFGSYAAEVDANTISQSTTSNPTSGESDLTSGEAFSPLHVLHEELESVSIDLQSGVYGELVTANTDCCLAGTASSGADITVFGTATLSAIVFVAALLLA